MDYHKLASRYKQFGGFSLVIEYAKLGALWLAVKAGVRCLLKRQSFKAIYPEVLRKIEPFLIQKYGSKVQEFKKFNSSEGQGISGVYEIKVIDEENWKEYIELPSYIVKKWEEKQIPPALFSDLLRLELLIKYGGTWIDSTVLCTGFKGSIVQEFKKYLEADLFLFQYTKQGSIPVSISNWFISACSNNEVLIVLRDMLYAYWKDYDCVLDYYIFHLFFAMISKEYPEQITAMPYGQSQNSLVLLHHWGEEFNQKKWDKLTCQVCFHKLAFRVDKSITDNKENYYSKIIRDYGNL